MSTTTATAAAYAQPLARSLVRKLAEVKGAVDRIAKNGHNDHFNYDFATESDIAAAVRKEMAERHLIMFPNVTKTEWEKVPRKNGETKLCTLTVEFTIEDGDSGETRKFTVLGQGEDSMDKATYKAMTGAEKYALLKLFMIPTGDDPEKDTEHRYHPKAAHNQAPTAAPNQPPTSPQPAPTQSSRQLAPGSIDHPCGAKELQAPFGKNSKGKCVCQLDAKDLTFFLESVATSLKDPSKKRFEEKNLAWQGWLQKFAALKAFGVQGTKQAPQAELDVGGLPSNSDDEALELLAQEFGLNKARITLRARGILNGKTSNFTQEDIATLRSALQAVPAS